MLVPIGFIIKPHGFRGALLAGGDSGKDSALGFAKILHIGTDASSTVAYPVLESSWMPKGWKLTLEGITGEDQVNALRGQKIFAERNALKALAPGQYYLSDLQGGEVRDAEDESLIGLWVGLESIPGIHDLWQVKLTDGAILLVPVVKKYIDRVEPGSPTRIYLREWKELT